ncbi:MAG TPA: hypothetical protein VFV38_34295, partial [Ktedonobacteraceae bacterium]|nr:hypothetical protein [Ktedonobacteraceae bacterium]
MYRFQPFPGMSLQIAGTNFEFVSHPLLPYDEEAVFVLEGSTAFVYQLRALDTKQWYALKVFKPAYRGKYIAQISTFLAQHADITAFQAERRSCLTMDNCSRLIQTFPELEYAILMPWAMTPTWTGILLNPEASAGYTFAQARDLALATANTLCNIESYGWAHTDIGGSNLVPSPDRRRIQLLDLEGFYIPGMPLPPKWSR